MELDFGRVWDIRRVGAVDGSDRSQVLELMGQENYDRIAPYVSEKREPNTINRAELGCVLSHLVAIRKAYLGGHSMAMIAEDDITPMFMYVRAYGRKPLQAPFCSFGIGEMCIEADPARSTPQAFLDGFHPRSGGLRKQYHDA